MKIYTQAKIMQNTIFNYERTLACHSCFQIFPNISFSVCLHIFICLLYKYLLWSCCFHGKKIALPARFCHEKRHTTALTEEANGCILGKNNGSIIFLNSHFLNSCDFTKYDAIIFHIKNL